MKVSTFAILALMLATFTADACVFQGDVQHTGNFTALGPIIPSLLWKANLTGLVDSQPVYYKGYVFVENWYGWKSWNPGLYCINATNGKIVWRNEKITGASTAAINGEKLIVGSLDGKLYFVNTTNGEIEKEIKLEEDPSYWGIASSPIIYNNSIYVLTFSTGTLWKIDLNGEILWNFTTGKISYYTSPAAYNGTIFFAGNESGKQKLYCIDENKNLIWSYDVDGEIMNTPSIGYGEVFFATSKKLYALYLNGTLAWELDFNGTISTAAIAYGNIYIGSKDGLYCISKDGKIKWVFKSERVDSSPAVASGYVYFATNTPEGTIYALDKDGKMIWYYRLKPPAGYYYNVMSSPFIADNKLFIGADSGHVYCFNLTGKVSVNVSLSPGSFTIKINNKSYEVNRTSALGALYYASLGSYSDGAEIGFNFTLDDSWYEKYGSFFLTSVFGISNSGGKYWMYWVNDESPAVGINQYELSDGDRVYYWYDVWTASPYNASIVLEVNVGVEKCALGDVNGDGSVDVLDLTYLVNIILGTTPSTACSDVNGDGSIDVLDLTQVVNIILSM